MARITKDIKAARKWILDLIGINEKGAPEIKPTDDATAEFYASENLINRAKTLNEITEPKPTTLSVISVKLPLALKDDINALFDDPKFRAELEKKLNKTLTADELAQLKFDYALRCVNLLDPHKHFDRFLNDSKFTRNQTFEKSLRDKFKSAAPAAESKTESNAASIETSVPAATQTTPESKGAPTETATFAADLTSITSPGADKALADTLTQHARKLFNAALVGIEKPGINKAFAEFTEHHRKTTQFVTQQLLNEQLSLEQRIHLLEFAINVAYHCFLKHDYYSAFSIGTALTSVPIGYLEAAWLLLSDEAKQKHSNLRNKLSATPPSSAIPTEKEFSANKNVCDEAHGLGKDPKNQKAFFTRFASAAHQQNTSTTQIIQNKSSIFDAILATELISSKTEDTTVPQSNCAKRISTNELPKAKQFLLTEISGKNFKGGKENFTEDLALFRNKLRFYIQEDKDIATEKAKHTKTKSLPEDIQAREKTNAELASDLRKYCTTNYPNLSPAQKYKFLICLKQNCPDSAKRKALLTPQKKFSWGKFFLRVLVHGGCLAAAIVGGLFFPPLLLAGAIGLGVSLTTDTTVSALSSAEERRDVLRNIVQAADGPGLDVPAPTAVVPAVAAAQPAVVDPAVVVSGAQLEQKAALSSSDAALAASADAASAAAATSAASSTATSGSTTSTHTSGDAAASVPAQSAIPDAPPSAAASEEKIPGSYATFITSGLTTPAIPIPDAPQRKASNDATLSPPDGQVVVAAETAFSQQQRLDDSASDDDDSYEHVRRKHKVKKEESGTPPVADKLKSAEEKSSAAASAADSDHEHVAALR